MGVPRGAVCLILDHRGVVTHSVLEQTCGWQVFWGSSPWGHTGMENEGERAVGWPMHFGVDCATVHQEGFTWVGLWRDNGIGFGRGKLEVPEGEVEQKRLVSHLSPCKSGFAADPKH